MGKDGYEESVAIPRADPAVVESAVGTAVKDGILWLVSGPASILSEEIPAGLLTDDAWFRHRRRSPYHRSISYQRNWPRHGARM